MFHFSTYRPSSLKIFPICQQTSECPMQRTAVHATEEQLIAPRYMIQISTHPAFFHQM